MKIFVPLTIVVAFIAFSSCEPIKLKPKLPPPTTTTAAPTTPAAPTEEQIAAFQEWKEKFGKVYATQEEEDAAMAKVLKNKGRIDAHNEKFEHGDVQFKRGLFVHSDMSNTEKRKNLMGVAVPPTETSKNSPRSLPDIPQFPPGPNYVNWAEKGLVGPVVDQGNFCSFKQFKVLIFPTIKVGAAHAGHSAPQALLKQLCARRISRLMFHRNN